MATEDPVKKATKAKRGRKPVKRRRRRKDDTPIGIGGGSGLVRSDTIGGITITFDRTKYVQDPKKSRRWTLPGSSLKRMTIIDEGQAKVPPVHNPNSRIFVNCVNTNTGSSARIKIKILTDPIGIEMPDDFVDHGDYYGSIYLGIKEIPVDNAEVPSLRGRCLFIAHSV